MPGSPAVSRNFCINQIKPTTKSNKLFSPFVDVNITVLDEKGRTVRTERRVSQPKGQMVSSPSNKIRSRVQAKPHVLPASPSTDSEFEIDHLPRAGKLQLPHRKTIILSDESGSEEDYIPITKRQSSKEMAGTSKLSIPDSKPAKRSKAIVEVVIPPAPYKLPRLLLEAEPPSSPPPPDDYYDVQDSPIRPAVPQPVPITSSQRYHFIPSPTLKPRQLTPIKAGRKRFFEPLSPPSPTTPTDFDLSIDFSNLSLSSSTQVPGQQDFEAPEYLLPLLEECSQETSGPYNFSAFIESFPYDPILQSACESRAPELHFRKIGEASYSEVFGIGDVVLKVIPIRDESRVSANAEEEDGPAPSDAKDVRKEIIVTRAMGEVYTGFVKLLKTYVVKGKYPEMLLQLWDEYNERKGSESVRPDTFKVSQTYAIIVLPNGGPDLEAYTFRSSSRVGWRQACSLFWQVAKALAHAELLVSFEHRDLHWGQILVKDLPMQTNALKPSNLNQKAKTKTRVRMDDLSHGVQATVIDLGLSRMEAGDGGSGDRVHWTPFDEEVFMGDGDYQFDVYRMMKNATGGDWENFHPMTNILWLHYLLQKLLYSKGLKPPSKPRKTKAASEAPVPSTSEGAFSEKDCYECLMDLEDWLHKSVTVIPSRNPVTTMKGKGRSKPQARIQPSVSLGPDRAGEVITYGVKKGWIEATRLY
ncbi:hypothetical protein CPB84DRAFT_1758668 [Gymnopilus junonius]|uniref:non-specific serine/threonine protein kinase n=1 Tax=Gymnopilus junonius TaxID=109634 RepID=A0A9P5P1W8_GYMJU|nr:hypothetical protein CPB84DRAFT_1758668 [Gymnopilus junonius]